MPPSKRARSYGGGGGSGLDLGGLLMAIYGGVETNPQAGAVGPTPSGAPISGGPMFKPKTIFDRNEASRMNAEYSADQYAADADVGRQLDYNERLNPIKRIDYQNQADVNTSALDRQNRNKTNLELETRPKF